MFLNPTDAVYQFSSDGMFLVSLLLLRDTSGILSRKEGGEGNGREECAA